MVTKFQDNKAAAKAFTLVELLIGMSLATVITLGVISGFTFLGRNMVRIANNSDLQTRATVASATLQKDVANATAITSVSTTGLTLTVDYGSGAETISYTYDAAKDELTRTTPDQAYVLLRNVTTCTFTFTDSNARTTSTASSVKKIELDATATAGTTQSGTYVTHDLVSPAMIVAGR
jgi:hypothetical protein